MSHQYYRLPGGLVRILQSDTPFPALEDALQNPNGLVAIGGNLDAQRLLSAYHQGIFPWFSEGEPILWWSPDPRMVLFPDELKISKSLDKRLRKQDFEIRFNSAFSAVISACAATPRPGQDSTWITEDIMQAYCELHHLGYAHSAETWIDGKLVGGLYGIQLGKMFFGESMFHHATDASKLAFVHMVQKLQSQGCELIDCQMKTQHLASLGAREIPRSEFSQRLHELVHYAV
ncbi:leucyl/phenylalanyl-tRNA--protein transferase [Methylobacillus rhizosphaerae]|uniref:Leucyl/phenylalanyl-tRNA--protein transferase n=1 Tax=Methylobacillus rhizosphaerae TaxID=551994 RepID=A0A238YVV7_9PROT|nr:leucyl/phenylalanyl-tRNA--protein transferase [Methylobacillus rhizosphaerae]SNR75267.1 leucyl/phenylalanyl-tRNA--protein transferase [Methylobacillus rhizosphaerae]